MRSALAIAVMAAAMLFALGGVAQAGDPAPDQDLPPAFAPPAPADVIDDASAEAFAERYAERNAARFIGSDRRRTRVVDANAACVEHPVVADRFGCVFTLRALTFERRGYTRGHAARKSYGDPEPRTDRRRRVRVRTFGCLGLLTVNGGPGVTPSGTLRYVNCVRVRNGDYIAPEPA